MKKIGVLIFVVAAIGGIVLAKMFSFGNIPSIGLPEISMFSSVKGSGNTVVEKRNVRDFKAVNVGGAFEIEINSGGEYTLEVEADDNLLPLITTNVDGETLRIGSEKRFSTSRRIKIRISAPDIERLDISGASKATLNNVANENLVIEASGASFAKVLGATSSLEIDMSGASRIDAGGLDVKSAVVEGSGASSAKLKVEEKIAADLSGASRVTYTGNPSDIRKDLSGGAKLRQED